MKVISVIEDKDVTKKILKHIGLWEINPPELWRVKERPPPRVNEPPKYEPYVDYSDSQLPAPARRLSGGSDNLSRAESRGEL